MAAPPPRLQFSVGTWVWSLYEGEWYEGEIESVDGADVYTVYYHQWGSSHSDQPTSSLQPWKGPVKPSPPMAGPTRRRSSSRGSLSPSTSASPRKRSTSSAQRADATEDQARASSISERKYYIVVLLARGSDSSKLDYFVEDASNESQSSLPEAKTMSKAGLNHGQIIDGAIVSGSPWRQNSAYLDLGEGFVPVYDDSSHICDVFTDKDRVRKLQIKGAAKLLPMKWLSEVNPALLLGCTVITKWDSSTALRAVVENVNLDGTFHVTLLKDGAAPATVNLSIKRILSLKAGPRKRFLVRNPLSEDASWQAQYKTVARGIITDIPKHGTVDEGTIVLGKRVNINDSEFIDLGEDKVPTGPSNIGKQKSGTRKLLPADCLAAVTAESMVGYRVEAAWRAVDGLM